MAVIKISCPKCGQKVSGDETFYGRKVNCPICTSRIVFPAPPNSVTLDAVVPGSPVEPTPPAGLSPSMPSHPFSQGAPLETIFPERGASYHPGPVPNYTPVQPTPIDRFPESVSRPSDAGISSEELTVPSPLLGAISLVVGILNTVTTCLLGPLLAPLAIILGHAGLARAKKSPVQPAPGQSLALIGVILGYAGLVFTIILLILALVFKDSILTLLRGAS